MKIMIIDDNAGILETLTLWASTLPSFEVMPFDSASLALKVFQSVMPYIVLCDYEMPEMNGVNFIRAAKSLNPLAECIMMTGNTEKSVIIEALQAGASDFVTKPFELSRLEITLQKASMRLSLISTLEDNRKKQIAKAVAICKTGKEAASKLGIDYATLHRFKKFG